MRARLSAVVLVAWLSACGGPGPAVMEFVETSPAQPKIGDVTTIRFKLLDERGVALAGQKVDFRLSSENSGVTLSPTSVISLRGSGFAETQIVATSVIVIATSGDKVVYSRPITFAGTVPSGKQFSFGCGPIAGPGSGGIHAIGAFDNSRHLIVGDAVECGAHVGDRNGDGIADVQVSFLAEAGAIGPSDVSVSDLVGDAVILYKTSDPIPVATEPETFTWNPVGLSDGDLDHTGEFLVPLWMEPYTWTEDPRKVYVDGNGSIPLPTVYNLREPRRTDPIRLKTDGTHPVNNPRDNLVAMIAVTSGEEGFDDNNNNGTYDEGVDTFDDLTEPFVDSNDSGTWEDGERYIDTNGNQKWDGKNGRWDANTLIWRQERILWTGWPDTIDTLPTVPGVPDHKSVLASIAPLGVPAAMGIHLLCPAGPIGGSCSQAKAVKAYAYIADPWFNTIAQTGDSDGCGTATSDMSPVNVNGDEGRGVRFTYPAGRALYFTISDVRDPKTPPIDQIPKRTPVPFAASVVCEFTSARKDGYLLKLGAGTLTGDIE